VRIQSILRKAADEGRASSAPAVHSAEERALALRLLAMPDVFEAAQAKRAPNLLCDYAFSLAQEFSRFYSEHHILSETDANLRSTRLALCKVTLDSLSKSLNILGIEVPARM